MDQWMSQRMRATWRSSTCRLTSRAFPPGSTGTPSFPPTSLSPEWTSIAWSWTLLRSPSWTSLVWRDSKRWVVHSQQRQTQLFYWCCFSLIAFNFCRRWKSWSGLRLRSTSWLVIVSVNPQYLSLVLSVEQMLVFAYHDIMICNNGFYYEGLLPIKMKDLSMKWIYESKHPSFIITDANSCHCLASSGLRSHCSGPFYTLLANWRHQRARRVCFLCEVHAPSLQKQHHWVGKGEFGLAK